MSISKLPWLVLVREWDDGEVVIDEFVSLVHESDVSCIGVGGITLTDDDSCSVREPEPGRTRIFKDQRGVVHKLYEQYWSDDG